MAADLEFYFPVGVNAPAVKTIEDLTNAWAAKNPQHNVKAVYAGNYVETTTKALTAAQAGTPPHVAVLLAIDIFTLVEEDVVIPISDIANSAEEKAWLDGFYKSFMRDATLDGKIYAVPFQRSTPVYYYNKDAFREAGLDPNTPPASWDDMIEVGKKLVKRDANGNVTNGVLAFRRWVLVVHGCTVAWWFPMAVSCPQIAASMWPSIHLKPLVHSSFWKHSLPRA